MDLRGPGDTLKELFLLAGAEEARFVIIPTASSLQDAGVEMQDALVRAGVKETPVILPVRDRVQALSADCAPILHATAVFFSGGNQARLTSYLGGTPVETALMQAYLSGCVMSGSSAGAAVLSKVMIAYGKSGPTPHTGMAQFIPGLGYTDRVVFDQHFRQRDRLGRLVYALCNHPGVIGMGVDEDTAAILETTLENKGRMRVVGKNAVTVVDARSATAINVADVEEGKPAAIAGMRVHVLTAGCSFDLETGEATLPRQPLIVES